MLLLKVLSLILCFYLAYGSDSSEELETLLASPIGVILLQAVVQQAYYEDKLGFISTLVDEQHETDMNNTLIGTQNIYGPNGEIIEVRTVELHIPGIANNSVANKEDEDDDDDLSDLYRMAKEMFDLTSKLGFSINIAATEYTKTGDVLLSAYIDQNLLNGYFDGIYVVNKTIEVNSSKEVNDHIKELNAKNLPVSVHKYDANGQFLSEESNVVPEYLVNVLSEEGDVNQKLLEEAQYGLATLFLKYQNNREKVPTKLSEYLRLKYPEYDINVFRNEPKSWYVNKDYKVNIQYDLFDWESSEEFIYSIFILTKEENVTSLNGTAAQ